MFILVSFFFTFLKPLFYLSCFIFRYKLKMKHRDTMFHNLKTLIINTFKP